MRSSTSLIFTDYLLLTTNYLNQKHYYSIKNQFNPKRIKSQKNKVEETLGLQFGNVWRLVSTLPRGDLLDQSLLYKYRHFSLSLKLGGRQRGKTHCTWSISNFLALHNFQFPTFHHVLSFQTWTPPHLQQQQHSLISPPPAPPPPSHRQTANSTTLYPPNWNLTPKTTT